MITHTEEFAARKQRSSWIIFAVNFAMVISAFGCGVYWRPESDGKQVNHVVAGSSDVADQAEQVIREKARLMADVARKVAEKIRAGDFKEYADIEDFESPLNKGAIPDYEPLRNAQDAMLSRDDQGNLKLSGPDDAKAWEETAAGFDRIANGKGKQGK